MTSPDSHQLTTEGGADVEVLRLGTPGPNRTVLFHAAVTGAHTLLPLARAVLERNGGGEAWLMNLPGYGRSTRPTGVTGLSPQFAAARAVLDHLEAERNPVHLIGHSFGGLVALRTALARPNAVRRLSLFEPIVFSVLTHGDDADRAAMAEDTDLVDAIIASGSVDPEPALAGFVGYWNETPWERLPKPARAHFLSRIDDMVADMVAVRADQEVETDYSGMAVPTDLLYGEHTKPPAVRAIHRLEQILANAHAIKVPEVGHMAPLLAAETVTEHLARPTDG